MFLFNKADHQASLECPYCLDKVHLARLLSKNMDIFVCPSCETEFILDRHTKELELWLGKITLEVMLGNFESKSENTENKNHIENYGNDLCRSCNHNQMIIMQLLHAYGEDETFVFSGHDNDEEAFEEYKNSLEMKYPLCKLCRGVVKRKLDAQAALARANFISAMAVRGKVSILESVRRSRARKRLCAYILLLSVVIITSPKLIFISTAASIFLAMSNYQASSVQHIFSILVALARATLFYISSPSDLSYHQNNFLHLYYSYVVDGLVPVYLRGWCVCYLKRVFGDGFLSSSAFEFSAIIDIFILVAFVNPDVIPRLFIACKRIPPGNTNKKEKKVLKTYHNIIHEMTNQNKENIPHQRFTPRPSILSPLSTGIEESFALCSLQDTKPSVKNGSHKLFSLMSIACCIGLFACSIKLIQHIWYQSLALVVFGEIIQFNFKRNVFFSWRVVLLVLNSLLMSFALMVNLYSVDRVEYVICIFYAIVTVLLIL